MLTEMSDEILHNFHRRFQIKHGVVTDVGSRLKSKRPVSMRQAILEWQNNTKFDINVKSTNNTKERRRYGI